MTRRSAYPAARSTPKSVRTIGQACGTPVTDGPYGPVLTSWQAFAPGQVPEPAVAPEDLAEYAYEVMDLKRPALEWNPHLASADDATLVNLPTWLWTQDPGRRRGAPGDRRGRRHQRDRDRAARRDDRHQPRRRHRLLRGAGPHGLRARVSTSPRRA